MYKCSIFSHLFLVWCCDIIFPTVKKILCHILYFFLSLLGVSVHRDDGLLRFETLVYRDAVGYAFIVYSTGIAVDNVILNVCIMIPVKKRFVWEVIFFVVVS